MELEKIIKIIGRITFDYNLQIDSLTEQIQELQAQVVKLTPKPKGKGK